MSCREGQQPEYVGRAEEVARELVNGHFRSGSWFLSVHGSGQRSFPFEHHIPGQVAITARLEGAADLPVPLGAGAAIWRYRGRCEELINIS